MIVLAESGSTKTDWRLISPEGVEKSYSTAGINPVLQPLDELMSYQEKELLALQHYTIDELYFYGAGCSQPDTQQKLVQFFHSFFPTAQIQVQSDLVAAGKALFGEEEGIACILGTGSNSCYFKENAILNNVHSLGYLLGDEGGGVQIGKRLMRDYLRAKMPEEMAEDLKKTLAMNQNEIYHKVYQEKFPNRFLAGLVGLLAPKYSSSDYFSQLVRAEFELFFENCLSNYENVKEVQIGFVGSIAYHFQHILKAIAAEKDYSIGKIISKPIDQLAIDQHEKSIKNQLLGSVENE